MINLSSVSLTPDQISVLELGLFFCPTQKVDQFKLIKDLNLFARKLLLRILFDKSKSSTNLQSIPAPPSQTMSLKDIRALEDLMELWDEGHISPEEIMEAESLSPSPPSLIHPPKEYKPKSNAFPALHTNPNVWAFIQQVSDEIKKTKWKGLSDSNLHLDKKRHYFLYKPINH